MTGTLRLLATGLFVAAAAPVHAQAAPPPSASGAEWRSMAASKVAAPLPATGPMASDLEVKAAPPRWADVPLPPPPAGMKAAPVPPAPAAAPAATAAAPAAPAAQWPDAAPAGGAPASAAPGAEKAPATQEAVAPPATSSAAGATAAGLAAVAAATPAAAEPAAAPPAGGGPGPAKVTTAVDQTGAMISVQQDLESDKIRMAWAESGGTLPAFEGNLGMLFMYKDLSKDAGEGAYMSGVGFSAGLKVALLTLEPPSYEKRDRSWTAWKLGVGGDIGVTSVTINLPTYRIGGVTYGGPQTATMSSTTLIMNLGFMHAIGSFDSPTDWSGMAIGIDWAPSRMSNTITTQDGTSTTSSSFNPRGFAINFESGSLRSMASKMGKKAKLKLSIFLLPPIGEMPFMMNTTIGAVWY